MADVQITFKANVEKRVHTCNWCGDKRVCFRSRVHTDADICENCVETLAAAIGTEKAQIVMLQAQQSFTANPVLIPGGNIQYVML